MLLLADPAADDGRRGLPWGMPGRPAAPGPLLPMPALPMPVLPPPALPRPLALRLERGMASLLATGRLPRRCSGRLLRSWRRAPKSLLLPLTPPAL